MTSVENSVLSLENYHQTEKLHGAIAPFAFILEYPQMKKSKFSHQYTAQHNNSK